MIDFVLIDCSSKCDRNKRFSRLSKMWAPGERLTGAPMKAALAHLTACGP